MHKDMNKNHGLPGIGITALPGRKGKQGNGFYFGPLDSFFTYIGDDVLDNLDIDYEDIDYDITYVQNEKRLDPKYKTGDILYITDKDIGDDDFTIKFMVEITDDLTTCTKSYFLKNITAYEPLTLKSCYDDHTYLYPITIVDASFYNTISNLHLVNEESNFHNVNEFIYDSKLSICYYDASANVIDVSIIQNDTSVNMDDNTYTYIPYAYFPENYHRQIVVNDGSNIYKCNYENIDISVNLISMIASKSTYVPEDVDNELLIYSQRDKALIFTTLGRNKLFFDNLYIKKDNIGNVDSYYTLYNSNIALDNNGNCYTLTESDYNASVVGFIIDPQKFLNNDKLDINYFNYGYTHLYWNYDEDSINSSTQKNTYYKANYIRGRFMSEEPLTLYVIKRDEYGNYIRNWDNVDFKEITNVEIRDLLINTTENKTLNDVSNKLYEDKPQINYDPDILKYQDVSGLIQVEYIEDYVPYNKIQTIDTGVEYRDYGEDTHLYIDVSSGDETVRKEYHDVLYVLNSSTEEDPCTGEDEVTYYYDTFYDPSQGHISKYIDVSYFSGIDNIVNPSSNVIRLDILDPAGLYYRHHEIIQWVADPEGLKYYSKKTKATYDLQSNSYIIEAEWYNTNNLSEYQKTKDIYPEPVFNINLKDGKMYLDASNNGQQPYIILCSSTILENSYEVEALDSSQLLQQYVYNSNVQLGSKTFEEIIGQEDDLNFLNDIYNNNRYDYEVNDEYAIYQIPYYITDSYNESYEKIYTQKIKINNFDDYRTLPEVNLRLYNELELLQNVNDIDQGVMCNQFQYFIDVDIDKFSYDDWGKTAYIKDPKLTLGFQIDVSTAILEASISDVVKGISIALVKPGIDVQKTSQKDLCKQENLIKIKQETEETYFIKPELDINLHIRFTKDFTIDEVYDGTYRIWVLLETINPYPMYIYSQAHIYKLEINAQNESTLAPQPELTYELNPEYLGTNGTYLYKSESLKAVVAPISYIAGYNQQMDDAVIINNKLQGSDLPISVTIKPYMLDTVETMYTGFTDREADSTLINWNGLKFKRRFLQDHVKSLQVFPVNINSLSSLIDKELPFSHYSESYFANDPDDIYDTYLELVYNADLYKSRLIEDQEQFIYNGVNYLSSKYDQFNNNSAVFIRQDSEYELRSNSLLNSMKKWNEDYVNVRYDSDNPYIGHVAPYGNGYQYIARTFDQGQHLEAGYMSLSDVKQLNNRYFFDTDVVQHYTQPINQPAVNNPYTPSSLFRSLLYQMKWIYPYYYSEDGLNYIKQLPLVENNSEVNESEMPYNIAYSIYPRILFNDEEQIIIVLMLRRPSIVEEEQYELNPDDIYIPDTDTPGQLTDPINVLD